MLQIFSTGRVAVTATLAVALLGCGEDVTTPPPPPGPTCPTTEAATPGVAFVAEGAIRGTTFDGGYAYLGIPYAKPPLGERRFAAPEAAGCFEATFEASSYGAACPQIESDAMGNVLGVDGAEDCLTLNAWVPQGGAASKPVLVFIHGGGNVAGSSSQQNSGSYLYAGDALASANDAVVVTFNYRLGLLGYLVHPGLDAESTEGVSGNYGLRDQALALAWVKRNVAALGGDPERVLLFGESGGAVNVCNMLASPLAAGTFSAATMQSGSCNAQTTAKALEVTDELLDGAGCQGDPDELACLRAMDTEALVLARPAVPDVLGFGLAPGPHVDGVVLPDMPMEVVRNGAHNAVPIMVGVNSDETSRQVPPIASEAAFDARLLAYAFGVQALADLIKPEYPVADYGDDYRVAFVALSTDAKFVCPARRTARAAAEGQSENVYRYYFTHGLDNAPALSALGAWHGLELLFLFQRLDLAGYSASPAEVGLAGAMGSYWTRFADGDPNGDNAEVWPVFTATGDEYLQLDSSISVGSGIRSVQCDFWDVVQEQL